MNSLLSTCLPKSFQGNNHNRHAIIMLDFQNEFVKPGGKLYDNGDLKNIIINTGMVKKISQIVDSARKSNGRVLLIHAPVVLKKDEQFNEADFDTPEFLKQQGLFTEGSWNADLIDEIKPVNNNNNHDSSSSCNGGNNDSSNEMILKSRSDFNAFKGTKLQEILERRKVSTLAICGCLTNFCIEETARAAEELLPDIDVFVLADGCAATSLLEHHQSIHVSIPLFATMISCSDYLYDHLELHNHGDGEEPFCC